MRTATTTSGLRDLAELSDLGRNPLESHIRDAASSPGTQLNPLRQFSPAVLAKWMWTYSKSFGFNHPFLGPGKAPPGTHSVYREIPTDLRLSIAGDWGSGTLESVLVAKQMMAWCDGGHTDLTIHLGDVYYIGGESQINENCLSGGNLPNPKVRVQWPSGRLGSFALQGNHEMYANGYGYFDTLLPKLGWKNADGVMLGQGPSFFCLEHPHWRIIGIDTGYNDDSKVKIYPKRCTLPDQLITWLRDTVRPSKDKATMILSHHPCFSAFEDDYPRPAEQLQEFLADRSVLWVGAHEHRLAAYVETQLAGFKVHLRCIGHGGLPVEPATRSAHHPNASAYLFHDAQVNPLYKDEIMKPLGKKSGFGLNGFAQFLFAGPKLTIRYYVLQVSNGAYMETPTLFREETFESINGNAVLVKGPMGGPDPLPV